MILGVGFQMMCNALGGDFIYTSVAKCYQVLN